jgi:heptosyltransferase-1
VLRIDTKRWRRSLFQKETRQEIAAFSSALKAVEYDLLFDLQGNSKSALITFLAKAKKKIGFGPSSVPEFPNLLVTNHKINVPKGINVRLRYLTLIQTYLNDQTTFIPEGVALHLKPEEQQRLAALKTSFKPAFMLAFGSKWANKRLDEDTLKQFVLLIDAKISPFFFFIWGDAEEKKVAEELQAICPATSMAVGQLTLPLWQGLMHEVDLVIAMDSAALHLCGTTNTPSFSVFGPSLASIYKPLGSHESYQAPCPYGRSFNQRCPKLRTCSTGACMRQLPADVLFKAFLSFWQNSRR